MPVCLTDRRQALRADAAHSRRSGNLCLMQSELEEGGGLGVGGSGRKPGASCLRAPRPALCGLQQSGTGAPAPGPRGWSPLPASASELPAGQQVGAGVTQPERLTRDPLSRHPAPLSWKWQGDVSGERIKMWCPSAHTCSGTPHGSEGKRERLWNARGREVREPPPTQTVKLKVLQEGGS